MGKNLKCIQNASAKNSNFMSSDNKFRQLSMHMNYSRNSPHLSEIMSVIKHIKENPPLSHHK